MLIESTRYTAHDLAAWESAERADAVWCRHSAFDAAVRKAADAIRAFVALRSDGEAYCGVSWGKDSVVTADLVARFAPGVPLVWVRVEPDYNPDCLLVRDAFLTLHPGVPYLEVEVQRGGGSYVAHGTLERGMAIARERLRATRYISGVRGEESGARTLRMRKHGAATRNTLAPIGWWTGRDVFAYLHQRRLPVHPAYACTMGGSLDRERVRVGPLGGQVGARPGDGFGRAEWERRYYGRELRALAAPG